MARSEACERDLRAASECGLAWPSSTAANWASPDGCSTIVPSADDVEPLRPFCANWGFCGNRPEGAAGLMGRGA